MREIKARIRRIVFGLGLGIAALQIATGPANAQTYSFKTLHAFNSFSLGVHPDGALLVDKSGNLFGITAGGGNEHHNRVPAGAGVVFELAANGAYRVLYSFCPQYPCLDGQSPNAGLVEDAAGNLYGTTLFGGAKGGGVIFKLTPSGELTVLYSFCSAAACADGSGPSSGLIRDRAGNLYGTTALHGAAAASNFGSRTRS